MKRLILISLLTTAVLFASAQTQSGVVKTRGRLVNGKLVPGTLLQGATVEVEGRQPVLAADGRFSFPVTGSGFRLKSVSKQGYTLVDAEVCRFYKYSATPLQIVMEMPGQRQSDQLAKERALRRQLEQRLQQREDEIEAMNVSLEEKNRLLLQVSQDREDNEKIIRDIAKYYATLDYDQLDEFQRHVNQCLETGDVARADSLLKSRGDLGERISQMRKEQATEDAEEAAIKQRQQQLDQGREGTRKKLELIAADCYNYYQRYLLSHQNDSAAYYLELRSSLDSNNLEWMNDAAYFIEFYLADYNKALKYYKRVLDISLETFGERHPSVATAYTGMGREYLQMGNTKSAADCFGKALEIRRQWYGNEHPLVANSLRNLGGYYLQVEDYENALDRFKQALAIYRKAQGENTPEVAHCYNSIGVCYMNIDTSSQRSMDNFGKALAIDTALYGINHPDVSMVYMNIANLYANVLGDNKKASEYYVRCLEIEKKLFGEKHPRIARIYNNMASNALLACEYVKAIDYSFKAIDIIKQFFGEDNIELVYPYDYIGFADIHELEYDQALQYFKKSEEITRKVYGEDALQMYDRYFCLAGAYENKDEFETALIYSLKALSVQEKHLDKNDESLADSHLDLARLYDYINDYDKALEHYSRALEIYKKNKKREYKSEIDSIKAMIEEIKQKKSEKKQK